MHRFFVVAAISCLVACGGASSSSSTSVTPTNAPEPKAQPSRPPPLEAPDKHVAWKGRDATVYEIPSMKMLEVIAPTEASGVDAEYQWLAMQHCGPEGQGHWLMQEQSLQESKDRQYDVLHCVCSAGGEAREFTFDITQYFGADFR